ncbi:MAG: SpoIID/LytB domain-containing protein [Lachnospiraceae bacterium]|nr:SpoIID/LytB domain-containing protein [Lachnospiraceae bacterium]
MRRTGRVIFIFLLISGCMMGLWMFQSWREAKQLGGQQMYYNVYVTGVSGNAITAVSAGESQTWETASAVTGQAVEGIADLHIQDEKIIKIVKKPETVTEKVLKLSEDTITLENYGEVPMEKEFVVYKRAGTGEITQGNVSDIVIGARDIRFVTAGKKFCAAVIPESELKTIRVLLKNNNFSSYDMAEVVLTATADFTIQSDNQTKSYAKGEKVTFRPADVNGRALVSTGGKGKIRVESLKRQYGVPEYRGTLEVVKGEKALQLINEVSLEEYLYSVVPSEMPTEYNAEALKAQAVCARSYAVRQMTGHRLAKYGAHVDDSVSFQVYNNLREDARAIEAVNATRNQVVSYQGKTAVTYFFSASCGSTSGTKDVWFAEKEVPYLTAAIQTWPRTQKNLTKEEDFKTYIDEAPETLDSSSPWYRWKTSITAGSLKASVNRGIQNRYAVNPTQIQAKEQDGTFRSRSIKDVGDIKDISVKKRGAGGIVSMVEIQGTKETVRVYTEYNIRMLFIGEKTVFKRQDKKEVTGLSILPSGFFYVKKQGKKFQFCGGGYGHGVGMSQNGANALAGQGKTYAEILTFYFPGTSVQSRESP